MNGKSRISRKENVNSRNKSASKQKGFTLLEIVVAVAIIGIMSILLYPSILNTLEKRNLESSARDVWTTIQRAKFQAVKTRINHRVRFEFLKQGNMDTWKFLIEREDNPGSWNSMPGFSQRFIPAAFNVTVDFPNDGTNYIVQFSPLGFITNYDINQNSLTIQSSKLNDYNQFDQRVVSVFIGGSVKHTKSQSGG